jgi:hypothetical protein
MMSNSNVVVRLADFDLDLEPEFYTELGDQAWDANYNVLAKARVRRLENRKELTIAELIQEQDDGLHEAFVYFLALTPEKQQRCKKQFEVALQELKAIKEKSRALARAALQRRGYHCE